MVEEVHALKDLVVPVNLALEVRIEDGKVDLSGLSNDDEEFVIAAGFARRGRWSALLKIYLEALFTTDDGSG
jgi:hypothetical protein